MNKEALQYLDKETLCEMVISYYKAISDVQDLINETGGVYGLHLDGSLCPWGDLLKGGRYEEWLLSLSEAGFDL